MANAGKVFEANIKDSVADDMYFVRLHDSAIGFGDVQGGKFAVKSPFDCMLYKNGSLYALELKTKGQNRIVFGGQGTRDIKEHQIQSLRKAAAKGVKAGFLFNFRVTNRTYYVPIESFDSITNYQMTGMVSIKEDDLIGVDKVILVPQKLKKVNYAYDLSVLFREAM